MSNRETTKGITSAEFTAGIYVELLAIPTKQLRDFFEEVDVMLECKLSQKGYVYFEAIKDYVSNRRMKEAFNYVFKY